MKSDPVARHYDQLTAHERLALVLAAAARHDDVEQDRLMRTAPRVGLTAPHQFRLTEAFLLLSTLQFMELLDTAGAYHLAIVGTQSKRRQDAETDWENAMLLGYLFASRWDGWRQFCTGLQFEPEALWEMLPGYATIQTAMRIASPNPQTGSPGMAFTVDGAARCLARRARGDGATAATCRPVTAGQIAVGLREVWAQLRS